MTGPIGINELQPVPPVENGLAKLKADIRAGNRIFCVYSASRDYHVSARDAEEVLRRAVARKLLQIKPARRAEERIYFPVNPTRPLQILETEESAQRSDLQRTHSILKQAYSEYDRTKKSLLSQGQRIHDKFLKAFTQLRAISILPSTVGNSAFNHQVMTLLMEKCFLEKARLIDYLREPRLLKVEPTHSEADVVNAARLELLSQKRIGGGFSLEEKKRSSAPPDTQASGSSHQA